MRNGSVAFQRTLRPSGPQLGGDVTYISRIARGERKSKVAEKALISKFNKVVAVMKNGLSSVWQEALCGGDAAMPTL